MNIAIIFGGQSVEHDISVLTGLHCAKNAPDEYLVKLVYLTRGGQMVTSGRYGRLSKLEYYTRAAGGGGEFFEKDCARGDEVQARPLAADAQLFKKHPAAARRRAARIKGQISFKKLRKFDCILNCCHGGVGEDGRLAAFFEVLQIPITSCPHLAAAALQSKSKTREILTANGFLQPKVFAPGEVTFPAIIKPDNGGSSIGISIAHDEGELESGIELAKSLCDKVVVEEFLTEVTEVNCAAFRYGDAVMVSGVEEIKKSKELFDFETKYMDEGSNFVPNSVQKLAIRAYEIFGCSGVVRFDFLVKGDTVILNEANTVPGFLAYHLWLKIGLPYPSLIQMMVENAVKSAKKGEKTTTFHSKVLEMNKNLV
jgi:D-alanine-D-alanine ligase